ncbi:MAG: hypothetical protein ACRD8U_24190 [Pyrinomonadaceae bacterium]
MKDTSDLKRQIGLPLVFLAISIVLTTMLPLWTSFSFTTFHKIAVAGLLFIAQLLVRILWLTSKVAAREGREEKLWTLREACDNELLCVRNCFVQIASNSYGNRDLFVAHFKKEIHQLAEKIKEAGERREMRVQADHFLNVDNVLDAFQGASERIWRYTWPIDGNHRLFDEHAWKSYFAKTTKMAEQGEIKEIRTVLVLDDLKLMQTVRVQKLLDFFHTNKGFECFTINERDYRSICSDNGMPCNYIDFGIYGDILLFLTEQYDPEIVGLFTKDLTKIEH